MKSVNWCESEVMEQKNICILNYIPSQGNFHLSIGKLILKNVLLLNPNLGGLSEKQG